MIPSPRDYGPVSNDASHGWEKLSLPREANPRRYLSFAVEDLAAGDNIRNSVNALSNAKRAIHFQLEIIANAFGLDCKRVVNFPPRLNFCQDCGIVGPRVLSKLNRVRNAVEHEYVIPTRPETEDFVDVVELFLAATDRFVFQFPNHLEFLAEPNSGTVPRVRHVKLQPGAGEVVLQAWKQDGTPDGWTVETDWTILRISVTDPTYFEWVKLLVQIPMYGGD